MRLKAWIGAFGIVLAGIVQANGKNVGQDWVKCVDFNSDGAIEACTSFIESDQRAPDVAIAYYQRGQAQTVKNNLDAAFSDYTKAIELNPKFDFALHNRALIYDGRGQYEAAIVDLSRSIAANPIGGHYFNRARVYVHAGFFDLAVADYTSAMDLWPGAIGPYVGRCRAGAAQGINLTAARSDCEYALKNDPKNSMFLTLRAFVELKQGDFGGVVTDAVAALNAPEQKWVEAKDAFQDVAPADALYLKGVAELGLSRANDGKADIAAATKLDATIADAYSKMGVRPAPGAQ